MHLICLVTLIINIYGLGWGSRSHLLFRASSKFRLIYCFFLVKSWFFIGNVHILRITHFSETTKDRNLIFGIGGDANVKLCIQHFYPRGSAPPHWKICFKKCDRDPHPKPYIFMIRVTRQIKCIIANSQNMYFFYKKP
jgi:hypothetical protein